MTGTVVNHLRGQWMGALALFLALAGGTALALPGSDTVFSDDIVNGEVKAADVGVDAAGSAEVADASVRSAELLDNDVQSADVRDDTLPGGGLGAADIAQDAIRTGEVAPNSIGGAEIVESSLGLVPSATLAGYGRGDTLGNCNPSDTSFFDCGFTTLVLPQATRVLIDASLAARARTGSNPAGGVCRIATSQGPLDGSEIAVTGYGLGSNAGGMFFGRENVALTAVTEPIGPGSVDFGVECTQDVNDIAYDFIRIDAVALSGA